MATVFDKLQLKDRKEIVVLNAPKSFEPELARLKGVTVKRALTGVKDIDFALAFVMTQAELDAAIKSVTARARGDAGVWFAYPKGSSKRYTSTINRDNGWAKLGEAGFEGVRMIAIDEDWSALRFRRAAFIKTMKRDAAWAMSEEGKAKAGKDPRPGPKSKSKSKVP
jgi:hypothetical protein